MATRHYLAIADLAPGEAVWSIVFPGFPGVTSAAARFADVPRQAQDALATAIEDMIGDGEQLPPPVEETEALPDTDTSALHNPRYLVVPVETAEAPVRINVSIDRGLLQRIDAAARRRGVSRSRFLAAGAVELLRSSTE